MSSRPYLLSLLFGCVLMPSYSQTLSTNASTLRFQATVGSTTLPQAQNVNVQSAPAGASFTVAISGPAPHFAGWLLV
ncbi:MAG: hypothetical protein ACK532_12450, partial [Acidobacteriota bacterium]